MTDTLISPFAGTSSPSYTGSPLESRRFLPALAVLFVGSGCAALIYEIVWLQLLQLVIGASAISLGVLLGTFMGGMCVGSLFFPRIISRSKHPLRIYAFLELGIGAIGLCELALVPYITDFYTHFGATGMASVLLRAALASICLLPPTVLMGATLPAIARWVESTPRGVSWLGFFYAFNTIGAVFGCLFAGFYLLPTFDMRIATYVAAAINAGIAVLGFFLSTITVHEPSTETKNAVSPIATPGAWAIYISIALSGLTGLGAEVVWTRLLSLMLGATVYTFSNILAVFLLGLGIGSSIGSFIARIARSPRLALAWCQFLLAGAIAWSAYAIVYSLPFWPLNPLLSINPWLTFQSDLARCFWAIFPGAFLWGASFPLALAAIAARGQDTGKLVGGVYAANTVGAIIGSLAFSMWLVPAIGSQGAQRLLILLCALSAMVAVMPLLMGLPRRGDSGGLRVNPASLTLSIVAALAIAFWLALGVGPANWASIAWGRHSASKIVGEESRLWPIYPPVVTLEEMRAVKGAVQRGLRSVHLENGELRYDKADAPGREADADTFLAMYHDDLVSAMKKREAITGKANLLAYGDDVMPQRYCTYIGEGRNVSVAVSYDSYQDAEHPDGYRYFHGAGKVQASSNPLDMHLQRTLGHISALTTRTKDGPKDVLVVACGAGVTAGSFVPYGSNITIVDIEPMVPANVTPQFWHDNHDVIPESWSKRPSGYPKTTIHIDDGRHYIRTTNEKFDVITSDPIDPWVKGCAALNTAEYYKMCREHLKPGGVMALWIPLYETNEDASKSVIATFFKVFPNGILWSNDDRGKGYDAVLFGAVPQEGEKEGPLKIDIDAMQKYIDDHAAVRASLHDVGYGTENIPGTCEAVELLATYAGSAPRLTKWTDDADQRGLINYDSNLRLQYIAGLYINNRDQEKIFNHILDHFSFPTEIFTGSAEHMAALRQIMESTDRIERP